MEIDNIEIEIIEILSESDGILQFLLHDYNDDDNDYLFSSV